MRVFTFFVLVSVSIMTAGCSSSGIKIEEKNRLVISNDQTSVEVNTPYMESYTINMNPVLIDQHIISVDEQRCIVYEEIRTVPGYRFNYAYKRSIDLIFDAYSVEERKRYGNLTLYRVTLRDEKKTVLNLLALTASKKSLKLIYGFSDDALATLEKNLENDNGVITYTLAMGTSRRDHCVQTKWQPKLLIMDNLVGKEGGSVRPQGL